MKNNLLLPKMYHIKQHFDKPVIKDIPGVIKKEFGKIKLNRKIRDGQSVAITAGSRGIKDIDIILKSVIDEIKVLGAIPFIFPAMGSHGGATAEGQKDILANYGITEELMGCEIKSTMEVVQIGTTKENIPVYIDKFAIEADHIVIVNRIKVHTKFSGEIESGLLKMCLIGVGKHEGAKTYHRAEEKYPWMKVLESVSTIIFQKAPITLGLAILQNAYEDISKLIAINPEDFFKKEPSLLIESQNLMGKLPFPDVDLLIIDKMGKEMSGTGMDVNITGRKEGMPKNISKVFIRDLTKKTEGNAQGIGLADFTTKKLVDKIDFNKTYTNSQTACRTDTCKIPMTLENDFEVLRIASDMENITIPESFKIIWIKNTLELKEILVSESYLSRIEKRNDLEIIDNPIKIKFDNDGNLLDIL